MHRATTRDDNTFQGEANARVRSKVDLKKLAFDDKENDCGEI